MTVLDKIKASLKWLKPKAKDARKKADEAPEKKAGERSSK